MNIKGILGSLEAAAGAVATDAANILVGRENAKEAVEAAQVALTRASTGGADVAGLAKGLEKSRAVLADYEAVIGFVSKAAEALGISAVAPVAAVEVEPDLKGFAEEVQAAAPDFEAQLAELEAAVEEAREVAEELAEKLTAEQKAKGEVEAESAEAVERAKVAEKAALTVRGQRDQAEKALGEARQRIVELGTEVARYTTANQAILADLATAQRQIAELEAAVNAAPAARVRRPEAIVDPFADQNQAEV